MRGKMPKALFQNCSQKAEGMFIEVGEKCVLRNAGEEGAVVVQTLTKDQTSRVFLSFFVWQCLN